MIVCENPVLEKCLDEANDGDSFQFERNGYFVLTEKSEGDFMSFNRIITLRDSWAKIKKN